MSKHGKAPLLIASLTLMIVVAASLYAGISGSLAQETPQEPEAELPIADYNAPEPTDKEKREKRRAKGEKYKDNQPIDPKGGGMTSTTYDHWFYGLTPLPTAPSEAVIVGEVTGANAYLTPDKSAVYSEYTIRVDEVLKTNDSTIVPNCNVDAQRLGGRVRLPSGQIQKYEVAGVGVPRVGRKYALFLVRYQQDLVILTGYELHQNKVKPLDGIQMFQVYKNMDVQTFMDTLRQAIITPQTPPRNEYPMAPAEGPPPEPEPDPAATPCAAPTPGPCTRPPSLPAQATYLKPNQEYKVTIDPAGFSQENHGQRRP